MLVVVLEKCVSFNDQNSKAANNLPTLQMGKQFLKIGPRCAQSYSYVSGWAVDMKTRGAQEQAVQRKRLDTAPRQNDMNRIMYKAV